VMEEKCIYLCIPALSDGAKLYGVCAVGCYVATEVASIVISPSVLWIGGVSYIVNKLNLSGAGAHAFAAFVVNEVGVKTVSYINDSLFTDLNVAGNLIRISALSVGTCVAAMKIGGALKLWFSSHKI